MKSGVQLIPGDGHVLVRGPLVVVMTGSAALAQDADAAIDRIKQTGRWTFEPVAAALQDLVTRHDPFGVAALLVSGSEPLIFLFDGAFAVTDGGAHSGNGREEWVTEMVFGDFVELRLSGDSTQPPMHGVVLRDGVVPAAGARVNLDEVLAYGRVSPAAPPPRAFNSPPQPQGYTSGSTSWAPPPPPGAAPPPPPPGTPPPPPSVSSGYGPPPRVGPQAAPPPQPAPDLSNPLADPADPDVADLSELGQEPPAPPPPVFEPPT